MVYVREAGLDVEEAAPDTEFKFVRARHSKWLDLVQKGGVAMIAVPSTDERQSTRWKITGALRARGIKASVRYALTPEGRAVYVVSLKP